MFQDTVLRLGGKSEVHAPIVVCSDDQRFTVAEQLREIGILPRTIILEPAGRNTAPALTIAALSCDDLNTVLLALPSDHVISDIHLLHQALRIAKPLAAASKIVTFGIVPTSPETGYGYIKTRIDRDLSDSFLIDEFVEKPDAVTAKQYLSQGNYYWNSGIFMFTASKFLDEMKRHRPNIYEACELALRHAKKDLDFIRLDRDAFAACPSESIDYAVMEHTKDGVVVPLDAGWSDLGSWSSIWDISTKDENNNLMKGDVIHSDTTNSYIHSEHRLVTTLGVDNLIVVETPDAVMVAHKDKVQDVKQLVDQLKLEGRPEAENHREVHRPWGKYDSIDQGPRYQVKRITVNPGAKLSVQMHHHRAEHWVVVSGTAKVTIDGKESLLSENQSTYVPVGVIHSLENPGKVPVELIEVQSGSYLGEDDIVRFEDLYGRKSND